ncbi:MAG TPA: hypothetical protein VHK89_07520 [Actinomycetota bacterium]|nr:hypothetical protein [Actinomycetota bacterium]
MSRSSSRAPDQGWSETHGSDKVAAERAWAERHRARVAAETRAALAGARRRPSLRALLKRLLP